MSDLGRCVLGFVALAAALGLLLVDQVDHELAVDLMPGLLLVVAAIVAAEISITKWRHDHE